MTEPFNGDLDKLIHALAQSYAAEGRPKEVAILASSVPEVFVEEYDNWNGGTYTYGVLLRLEPKVFLQISEKKSEIEQELTSRFRTLLDPYPNEGAHIVVSTKLENDPKWREKAKTWLSGKNINNQGKVRSDNIASLSCDGLLFRSPNEIFLYKALKDRGVSFAPYLCSSVVGNNIEELSLIFS